MFLCYLTLKGSVMEGQVVTIQCFEGYEFPSAPEAYTPAPAPAAVTPLAPLTLTESSWSVWGEWSSCSVTCGTGVQKRWRDCDQEGLCKGTYREENSCDAGTCGMGNSFKFYLTH